MSLADDLAANAKTVRAPFAERCLLCAALRDMPDDEAQALRSAISGRLVSQRKLADILTRNGYPMGETLVGRHIRQEHP